MPPKGDDERKVVRRHPGYEPTDPPPPADPSRRTRSERAEAITVGTRPVNPRPAKEEPKGEPEAEPRDEAPPPPAPSEKAGSAEASEPGDAAGMARIETLLANGDWARVADLLAEKEPQPLPAREALVYALARHESGGDADTNAMTRLAIESVARLLDVPASSGLALVIAKRLLRKTPVSWARRPAPPARVSVLIVLVVLILSGALGWFLSSTHVKWRFW